MKIKKVYLIFCLITLFSLTSCTNDSSIQNNSLEKTANENTVKEEKLQGTAEKKDYEKEEKKDNKPQTEISEKQSSETKNSEPIVLKMGIKGENVKTLQEKLNKFGYKLKTDGIFGQGTYNAVCDFQKRNKLSLDGTVGKKTLTKLNLPPTKETMYVPKALTNNKPVANNSSKASSNYAENFINSRKSSSPTQYYIWVNTKSPKVYIFEKSSDKWALIKNMPCTVGKTSTPTIKGTFSVGGKGDSFIVRNNPKLMCKYYTQIKGDYLFHSVLLHRNGSIANGRLGAKISHGCIRLSMNDAKYIHDSIPGGTTIYIN